MMTKWFYSAGLALFAQSALAAPYTLDELLGHAMTSYPTILSKLSNQVAAQDDLTASKLRFLPSPSISTQRNRLGNNSGGLSASGNNSATTVGISQPVFMGGGLIAGYDKASAKLSSADYALLETREDVSKRLITSYAESFRAYRKIKALEENVQLHQKFAGLITRRVEAGVASPVDRDLGVSRLYQAQADLDSQISAEKTALLNLSQIVGKSLTREDLVEQFASPATIPKDPGVLDQLLANSPTVARASYDAQAAEAESREVRASGLPQVMFQAQRQLGNPYVPGASGYDSLGFVVQYSPGGGFASFAASSAANRRAQSASEMVEATKRDLISTWNAELNEYQSSALKIASLKDSAGLTASISESYDRQYLVGRKSWLDVMNAIREQTQTQMTLIDAQASALGSSRRLQVLINGTADFEYMKQNKAE
jgi:adhesin transport system outer membrane protein